MRLCAAPAVPWQRPLRAVCCLLLRACGAGEAIIGVGGPLRCTDRGEQAERVSCGHPPRAVLTLKQRPPQPQLHRVPLLRPTCDVVVAPSPVLAGLQLPGIRSDSREQDARCASRSSARAEDEEEGLLRYAAPRAVLAVLPRLDLSTLGLLVLRSHTAYAGPCTLQLTAHYRRCLSTAAGTAAHASAACSWPAAALHYHRLTSPRAEGWTERSAAAATIRQCLSHVGTCESILRSLSALFPMPPLTSVVSTVSVAVSVCVWKARIAWIAAID